MSETTPLKYTWAELVTDTTYDSEDLFDSEFSESDLDTETTADSDLTFDATTPSVATGVSADELKSPTKRLTRPVGDIADLVSLQSPIKPKALFVEKQPFLGRIRVYSAAMAIVLALVLLFGNTERSQARKWMSESADLASNWTQSVNWTRGVNWTQDLSWTSVSRFTDEIRAFTGDLRTLAVGHQFAPE